MPRILCTNSSEFIHIRVGQYWKSKFRLLMNSSLQDVATEIIVTLGQAFELAYKLQNGVTLEEIANV